MNIRGQGHYQIFYLCAFSTILPSFFYDISMQISIFHILFFSMKLRIFKVRVMTSCKKWDWICNILTTFINFDIEFLFLMFSRILSVIMDLHFEIILKTKQKIFKSQQTVVLLSCLWFSWRFINWPTKLLYKLFLSTPLQILCFSYLSHCFSTQNHSHVHKWI